jgi:hypothetical protein
MAVVVTDNFNRDDAGNLGANWTIDCGSFDTDGSRAKVTTYNLARARYTGDIDRSVALVRAKIWGSTNGNTLGLGVRISSAGNGYWTEMDFAFGTTRIRLCKGSYNSSWLGPWGLAGFADGDEVGISVDSNNLVKAYWKGNVVGSGTDSTYSTGKTAITNANWYSDGYGYFDDFVIEDLVAFVKAAINSPEDGSHLASTTQTFAWGGGVGVDHYRLQVGTTPGGGDLFDDTTGGTSQEVTGLPNNGSTIYVRLTTVFTDSSSGYHDYSYTAVTQVDRVFRLEVESLQALSRKFRLEIETRFGWVVRKFRLPVEASGSILRRKFVLPVAVLSRHAVARRFNLPIETVRTFGRSFHLPIEWTGTQLLMRPFVLPIEAAANPGRTFVLPVEWVAGRLPPRKFMLPIEAKGALGRAFHLPVEATGQNILYRKFRLPVALSARLRRAWRLPIEASGLSTGFVDSWNVWQKLDDLFLDQWVVIPVVEVLQFSDTWNVKSVLGGRFTDTWRVLPREIVTLFSTDIQLPSGTVDKT